MSISNAAIETKDMVSLLFKPKDIKEFKQMGIDIESMLASEVSPILAWEPQPGKQEMAYKHILDSVTHIIGYGGGRGCGKTEVGIASTIQRMLDIPHFNGLYLRRTTKSLEEVISRIKSLLIQSSITYNYNHTDKIFSLSNGAKLRIFYTDGEGLDALQGSNINHLVIEEPQQIPNLDMVMVKVKAFWRSAHAGVIPKMVLLFNPLGAGTKWLKEKIVSYGADLFINDEGYSQVFIRALITDNPLLMRHNPQYIKMLENAPEAYRKAWLEGDFNVNAGAAFENLTQSNNGVDPFEINGMECFISMDWGFSDPLSVGFFTIYKDTLVVMFDEVVTTQKTPHEASMIIKEVMRKYENAGCMFRYLVADPSIFNRNQGISIADQMHDMGLYFEPAYNDRESGFVRFLHYVNTKRLIVFNSCKYFWGTVPSLELDMERPNSNGDIGTRTKQDDHAYDMVRYALMSIRGFDNGKNVY